MNDESKHAKLYTFSEKSSEVIPELNYIAGVTLANLQHYKQLHTSPATAAQISTGWNVLDGACQIVGAVCLLTDKESHHQFENKVKSGILGLSATQLIGLTLLNCARFAGPAFAIAVTADFTIALIDFFRAYKKASFEGWMDESLGQLNHIQKRIEKESKRNPENSRLFERLRSQKTQLLDDIKVRVRVHSNNREERTSIYNILYKNKFKHISNDITEIRGQIGATLESSDNLNESRLQKEAEDHLNCMCNNTFLRGMSMVGMTLMAIPTPATQIVGLLITSIVAMIYLYKNLELLPSKDSDESSEHESEISPRHSDHNENEEEVDDDVPNTPHFTPHR